jgi:osmotically-inducible protein OsmY
LAAADHCTIEEVSMKTTSMLQHDVLEELKWTTGLTAGEIGVAVHDGVVTLSGHVQTYAQKMSAEKATKRVRGVKGVTNDLAIRLPARMKRDDTDITDAAVRAIEWHSSVPEDRVTVTVRNGRVTLEGEVEWYYQKDSAFRTVRDLTGVTGVINAISVRPRATANEVKRKVEAAFKRSAEIDAKNVLVDVVGSRVVLRGNVRSWPEYEEAQWAAWSAPGVTDVDNQIRVQEEVLVPPTA